MELEVTVRGVRVSVANARDGVVFGAQVGSAQGGRACILASSHVIDGLIATTCLTFEIGIAR